MRDFLWSLFERKLFEILTADENLKISMQVRKLYWLWRNANLSLRDRNLSRLPVIVMNVVDHCNLNCRGCSVWSPLCEPKFTDIFRYERDITRLGQLFDKIDQINLAGGEPMIHPEIKNFLSVTRSILPKTNIVLNTNGLLLTKASDDFWTACSENQVYIRLTNYPLKLDLKAITDIAKSHRVMLSAHPIKQFLKFQINLSGNSNQQETFTHCRQFYTCNFLQDGRIYPCSRAARSNAFAEYFDLNLPICDEDSIDIHSNVTGKEIFSFLEKPIPWCRFCSTSWPTVKWEPSKRMLNEWI